MTAGSNLVDSSGWIEFLVGGPGADVFADATRDIERLIVPSIYLLEVFRWVLRERGEGAALQSVAAMQQGQVVDMDSALALRAAAVGLRHRLPLADSVIYATAQARSATLWTQDADFERLSGVRYLRKG